MSVKRLTDEECDDIRAEVGIKFAGPFGQFYERDLMRAAWSRGLQRAADIITRLADGRGISGHDKRHTGEARKWTTSAKKDKAAEMALRQAAAAIDREREGVRGGNE